jgi:hypothetical protein
MKGMKIRNPKPRNLKEIRIPNGAPNLVAYRESDKMKQGNNRQRNWGRGDVECEEWRVAGKNGTEAMGYAGW